MTNKQETKVLNDTPSGISEACRRLKSGELVAFPTETVYGLGADARNSMAVAGIFKAKERPTFNPLIVHVESLDAALELIDLPPALKELAKRSWPGPLTLVAPIKPNTGISDLVTSGLDTLAVRVPNQQLALKLLSEFGGPLAAPSANPSGLVSPTTVEHVIDGLSGKIAAVLDGGPCSIGLESTIVGIENDVPTLLRAGGLSIEDISEISVVQSRAVGSTKILAPGQLQSHYATKAEIRLNSSAPKHNEAYLAFGNSKPDWVGLDLSPQKSTTEAAANLFAHLRSLDQTCTEQGIGTIAIAPIPDDGLGLAINDRLKRAAAPRNS